MVVLGVVFWEKGKEKGECGVVGKDVRGCVFWLEVKIEPEKQKGKERGNPFGKRAERVCERDHHPQKPPKTNTHSLDQILRTLKEGKENG